MKFIAGEVTLLDYIPPQYGDIPEMGPLVMAIHDAIVVGIRSELPGGLSVGFGGKYLYVDLSLGDVNEWSRWVMPLSDVVGQAANWCLDGGHGTDRPEILETIKAFREQADYLERLLASYEDGS